MGKLCGGRSHVVLLVGSRGAKGTEGFRTEQLSTRRVIILFPMSRTFSGINKELEIDPTKAQRDLRHRTEALPAATYAATFEQADNLVQKLERQIPPESNRD
jgi:hypothetical protein